MQGLKLGLFTLGINSAERTIIKLLIQPVAIVIAILVAPLAWAQLDRLENPINDSTVIYRADYFAEFLPDSASDMISRIPGIGLAMRRGRGGGGRGLGSGEGEILINGQRITGKGNTGQSLLSRISADQVDYIERTIKLIF